MKVIHRYEDETFQRLLDKMVMQASYSDLISTAEFEGKNLREWLGWKIHLKAGRPFQNGQIIGSTLRVS